MIEIDGTERNEKGEFIPINQYVDWNYPDIYTIQSHIILGLCHTRAADSIRISYDGNRDRWMIEQASKFMWNSTDTTNRDPDWKEVAFINAWARLDTEYEKSIWGKDAE